MEHRFTYPKKEKIKSRKLTDELFSNGKTIQLFPLKLFYSIKENEPGIKAGVGVGKRHFKKAVHRNRIKRLLREAYRLNKQLLHEHIQQKNISLFILFTDKELPTFEVINSKLQQLLATLQKKINEVG